METGGNNSFVIESSNFNTALASNYHLSIEIGIKYFAYCLLNTGNLTYEYARRYSISSVKKNASEISEIISNDDVIKNEFSSQSIAFVNFPSTLVPSEIYRKENAQTFLEFNTKVIGEVISEEIASQEAHLIYCVPKNLLKIVHNFFPHAKQKSQENILIQQYNKLNNERNKAYAYLNNNKVVISIFKGKKLILNNTFEYFTKEDLLYFLLFSFEQLNLSTKGTELVLFGDIEIEDEYFYLLYQYVEEIKLGNRPHHFTFPNVFSDLSNHKYFGLFTQVLCA